MRRTAAPVPGPDDRVRADRRVVLLVDRPAGREVRGAEQAEQDRARIHPALGQSVARVERDPGRRRRAAMGRRRGDARVDDGVAREGRGRHPGDLGPAADDGDVAVVGHDADDGDGQAPPLADLADLVPALRLDRGAHPLLRLGDHHLEWRHVRLTAGDRVEVDPDARARPVRGLGCGARDPTGAEVLESLDESALDELERCLDQQLLGERVADLHARPLRGVVLAERGAREHGRPADAVASRGRSEQDDEVARAGGRGQGEPLRLEQPDGHDVDERVALVRGIEHQLAPDRRDPDAVAVAADAAHDPVDEMAGPRIGRIAEAQRIEDRDRSRAHREDVAQDPADAGRGTLVRLDGARVVVRFDLERDRQAVPDRDDPRVLARAGHDTVAGRRQGPQERLRALVRAVLAPHHAEHRELELVGVAAAEPRADRVELVVGHAQPAMERLRGALRDRHRAATRTEPPCSARRRALDERAHDPGAVRRPEDRLGGPFGMRHEPGHVAGGVADPGDGPQRAVRVGRPVVLGCRYPRRVHVPEQDAPVALQGVEGRRRRRSNSPPRGRSASAADRPRRAHA